MGSNTPLSCSTSTSDRRTSWSCEMTRFACHVMHHSLVTSRLFALLHAQPGCRPLNLPSFASAGPPISRHTIIFPGAEAPAAAATCEVRLTYSLPVLRYAIISRKSQHSQECKDPRWHCLRGLCASRLTIWPQDEWVSRDHRGTLFARFGGPSKVTDEYNVFMSDSIRFLTKSKWYR